MNTVPCFADQVSIADTRAAGLAVQSTFVVMCRKAAGAADTAACFELWSPEGSSLEL